jgi:5'-nucleotidase
MHMKPRILLTNDDGVSSVGLWAAYEALVPIADVTIVAPATQQSAVGRSISIFEPLRASQIIINGVPAWSVSGKPTDAVIIGLYALRLDPVLIVSGINIGENLSFESIMTSGTAGAALEGSNQGTKGIAFSLQVEDQGAKNIVRDVVARTLSRGFCPHADIINVNIPSHVRGGYEITRLARKLFSTGVERRFDPRGRPYFWINGPLIEDAEEGTDVHAIRMGNVSITPITLDCTAYNAEDEARTLFLG